MVLLAVLFSQGEQGRGRKSTTEQAEQQESRAGGIHGTPQQLAVTAAGHSYSVD